MLSPAYACSFLIFIDKVLWHLIINVWTAGTREPIDLGAHLLIGSLMKRKKIEK